MSPADEILSLIEELRAPEGASITINCRNPDFNGLKNESVVYCGPATNWKVERFDGDTLAEALRKAAATVQVRPLISHVATAVGYQQIDWSKVEENEKDQSSRPHGPKDGSY